MEDSRRIYKFNGSPGEDFQLWEARTEAALEAKDVLSVVTTDVIGDGTTELMQEVKLSVAKARATIIQGLGEKPLRLCMSEKGNPYKMWLRLSERYAFANIVTKVQLQTKLARTTYAGQPMSEFIDSFEEIFNRLAAMDSHIAEDMQVAMLLASFCDKETSPFGYVIAALQSFDTNISWETCSARLLQEYEEKVLLSTQPKPLKEKKDSTQALIANHPRRKGKGSKRIERRKCYGCGKKGHLVRDCTDDEVRQEPGSVEKNVRFANHATLLMARKFEMDQNVLIVDSGASDHMVMHREWLSNVEKIEPRTIVLGNGHTVCATYKGEMTIEAKLICSVDTVNRQVTLRHVLLVPELKANLISCSALSVAGFEINIGRRGCSVLQDGCIEFHARPVGGLYVVIGTVKTTDTGIAMTASRKAVTLWHDRLGHAHAKSIKELSRKNSVIGLDLSEPRTGTAQSCEDCTKGKQSKLHLREKVTRSQQKGEIIHRTQI